MMRRNTASNDCFPVAVIANFGTVLDEGVHEFTACVAATFIWIASGECSLGCCLIATASSRHENDGRQEVVRIECRKQCCRRHLRHSEFHKVKSGRRTLVSREAEAPGLEDVFPLSPAPSRSRSVPLLSCAFNQLCYFRIQLAAFI